MYEVGNNPPVMICGPRAFVERTMIEVISGEFASDERRSGTWRREDDLLTLVLDDDGSAGGDVQGGTAESVDRTTMVKLGKAVLDLGPDGALAILIGIVKLLYPHLAAM